MVHRAAAGIAAASGGTGVFTFLAGALEAQAELGDPTNLWIATAVTALVFVVAGSVWLLTGREPGSGSPRQSMADMSVGGNALQAEGDINYSTLAAKNAAVGDALADFMDDLNTLRHAVLTDQSGDKADSFEQKRQELWSSVLAFIEEKEGRAKAQAVRNEQVMAFDTVYDNYTPHSNNSSVLNRIEIACKRLSRLLNEY